MATLAAAVPGAKASFVTVDQATLAKEYKIQIPADLVNRFEELFISSKAPLKHDNVHYIAQTAIQAAQHFHHARDGSPRGFIPAALAERFQRLKTDGVTFTILAAGDGQQIKYPESFQK